MKICYYYDADYGDNQYYDDSDAAHDENLLQQWGWERVHGMGPTTTRETERGGKGHTSANGFAEIFLIKFWPHDQPPTKPSCQW